MEFFRQKPGKGEAAQTDFENDHVAHKFDQIFFGQKEHQPVKRACAVVAVKRQVIGAHTDAPGVVERLAVAHFPDKFFQKGDVLMVHVGVHEALISEGINAVADKNRHHGKKRQQEGKETDLFFHN